MPLFNTISVISWWSVLLVEDTGVPGENHRPAASHWQTLSHNVVHLALIEISIHNFIVVIGTDCTGSCKSNYHMTTTTTAPNRRRTDNIMSKRLKRKGQTNYLQTLHRKLKIGGELMCPGRVSSSLIWNYIVLILQLNCLDCISIFVYIYRKSLSVTV